MNKDISSRTLQSIDEYVKGNLGPEEVEELWIQLLEHPEYYPLLRTEAGLHKYYKKKQRPDKNGSDSISVFEANRPWVLSLAALILLGLFLNLFRTQVDTEIHPMVTEISFLHLVSPDVTRSSADQLSGFDQALHRAFQHAVSGNREAAITGYRELMDISETPEDRTVLYYNLGITHFNTGNYEASARSFGQAECSALRDRAYIESCHWYQANSFIAINDFDRAYESAFNTLTINGVYRDDAFTLLRKLQAVQ